MFLVKTIFFFSIVLFSTRFPHFRTSQLCEHLWAPRLKGFLMSKWEKALVASQKYLQGLKQLPRFVDLRGKQKDNLLSLLSKDAEFSTEKAGHVLSILDRELWGQECVEELCSGIASKTRDEGAEAGNRRSMQDYRQIVHYLPKALWEEVADDSVDRASCLEKVSELAKLLGLQCPTEATLAALVALVHVTKPMTSKEKFSLLKKGKPKIKKVLSSGVIKGGSSIYLLDLPSKPEDCPRELISAAYPSPAPLPIPSPLNVFSFEALVSAWPLRSNNILLSEEKEPAIMPDKGELARAICLVAEAFGGPKSTPTPQDVLPDLRWLDRPQSVRPQQSKQKSLKRRLIRSSHLKGHVFLQKWNICEKL